VLGEAAWELPSFGSGDFSPADDVPLHGTLGLKSKPQKLGKKVLSQS